MTVLRLMATLQLLGREEVQNTNSPAQTEGTRPFVYRSYGVVDNIVDLNLAPVDLSSDPDTIDLTAAPLARARALSIDLTDAVLHSILCYAHPGNDDPISIAPASSNGYPVPEVSLPPGARFAFSCDEVALTQVVDATHKDITIAGTAGDLMSILAFFASPGTASDPVYDSPEIPEEFSMKILRTPQQLTVLTPLVADIATATEIDLGNYSSLTVMYADAPGVVTVYGIVNEGDTYGIAQEEGADITFTPTAGKPTTVNPAVFGYLKIKLIAGTTQRTATALIKA